MAGFYNSCDQVLSSCKPIEKEVVEESDSNVVAKEEDYVRINLVVKDLEGNVRDSYFQENTLELYMKHHVAKVHASIDISLPRLLFAMMRCVDGDERDVEGRCAAQKACGTGSCMMDDSSGLRVLHQMVLNEKASFKVYEPIMDKHGNKPFWGDGAVELEVE